MQLAGCKAPKLNALIFISVFLGFIEMLYVYVFLEEEEHKRKVEMICFKERLYAKRHKSQQRQQNKSETHGDVEQGAVEENVGEEASDEPLADDEGFRDTPDHTSLIP
jgi:hypothetical protein